MDGSWFRCTATISHRPGHYPSMSGRSTCRIISILTPVIVILACAVLPCGCLQQGEETGRFMGTVSVGPLCTVEPCTVSHDRLIAAYAARPITVTTSAGLWSRQ